MKQLKYPFIASFCWGIIGGFFHSAWSMIIGTGVIATLVFAVIWFIPLIGIYQWATKRDEAASRSMARCLRILASSNNAADRAFAASANQYNRTIRGDQA